MEDWKQNLISSIVLFILATTVLLYAMNLSIPSAYKTFLGIPYATNPQYSQAIGQFWVLFTASVFAFGMGFGAICVTYSVYKAEKKVQELMHFNPIGTSTTENKYCQYCGMENNKEAFFCRKCGKTI